MKGDKTLHACVGVWWLQRFSYVIAVCWLGLSKGQSVFLFLGEGCNTQTQQQRSESKFQEQYKPWGHHTLKRR